MPRTAEQMAELRSRKKTPGRPPGSCNSTTKDLKRVYLTAFDRMGGVDALIEWGTKSPDLFYSQISKLLPKGVEIKTDQQLTINIISAIPEPLPLEECDLIDVTPEKAQLPDKTASEDAPQSTNAEEAIP